MCFQQVIKMHYNFKFKSNTFEQPFKNILKNKKRINKIELKCKLFM